MNARLTVLAEDALGLDFLCGALAGVPRLRVAERQQSVGADLAWTLAARPLVQVLRLDLCPAPPMANGEPGPLSEREIEVLRLMAQGHSYVAVAARLGVAPNTVASHVKNAYRKLAVHSAAAAVMRAVQMRLIGA